MMQNGDRPTTCDKANVIPEYIYQELSEKGRVEMERHIVECAGCSAELAGMENAHLAVMQWRNEAFAGLPTPKFVIPYGESTSVPSDAAKSGWLTSIRELFDGSPVLRWGGGLAALSAVALIVFLGSPMLRVRNEPSFGVDVVSVKKQENPEKPGVEPSSKRPDETMLNGDQRRENVPAAARSHSGSSLNRKGSSQAAHVASAFKRVNRPLRKLPSLDDVADEDDNSLRLSELFDQIGS